MNDCRFGVSPVNYPDSIIHLTSRTKTREIQSLALIREVNLATVSAAPSAEAIIVSVPKYIPISNGLGKKHKYSQWEYGIP